MAKKGSKYYVVWIGKSPGIYETWKECQVQISGYPSAKYKSFPTKEAATEAFRSSYDQYYSFGPKKDKKEYTAFREEIIWESICVDAACSGNPGLMEYQGVTTSDKTELFHKGPFEQGTNNIGEFLALVHALAYLNKLSEKPQTIYSDSKTAMSWVRNKKVKTNLKPTEKNQAIFELIDRAVLWLKNNNYNHKILKWNTEKWGEIPADFGRK
jgi:ribonuclease HI